MEKKLQKIYLTYCNLLIAESLLQVHYQILSIMFLKGFIKLNVITDTIIKNVKLVELHTNHETGFLKINFKYDLTEYKCLCCNKNYQQKFDENLKKRFYIYIFFYIYNFLITTIISLFYCYEKVFIYMNKWMIGTNSIEHHYLKKMIFTFT